MRKRYESIADDVRQKIHAGDLVTGGRLPAEAALAAEYRTSMPTTRQSSLTGVFPPEARSGIDSRRRCARSIAGQLLDWLRWMPKTRGSDAC
ncbi:GntR family transcriptional regulator [Streptomyces cucumeris]|uniref:GntR family transcriptional regulator n=1 Tax=Streptomyces cucumeris TaxID=2962890 RepID=UPI003D70C91F